MHTPLSREQRSQQSLQQQPQQPQQGSGSDLAHPSAMGPHTNSNVITLIPSPGQVRLLLVCAVRGVWVSSTSMQMDGSEVARKPQCHGSTRASLLHESLALCLGGVPAVAIGQGQDGLVAQVPPVELHRHDHDRRRDHSSCERKKEGDAP